MTYTFLGQEYRRHWAKRIKREWDTFAQAKYPDHIELLVFASNRLDIEQEEYIQKYLKPWCELDFNAMSQLASALTAYSSKYFQTPIKVTVEHLQEHPFRTLDWLTVHLLNLNLPGFRDGFWQGQIITDENGATFDETFQMRFSPYNRAYIQPYRQCLHCGRLDQDLNGREFNKKNKYCHHKKCCSDIVSNPSEHETGCCYKAVALERKSLTQKLNRMRAKKASQKEMSQCFAEFIRDKQSYITKNIQNSIRPENTDLAPTERLN